MKRITIILLAVLMAAPAFGVIPITRRNVSTSRLLDTLLRDRIGTLDSQVSVLQTGATSSSGVTYYVDSANGADTFTGKTWTTAKATVEGAMDISALTNKDTILVREGYSETQSVTGAVLTADVAGVTIKGLGAGRLQPKFILSHTGATVDVTADNVTFDNFQIDATGVDSVNTPINLSGVGVRFVNCYLRLADTVGQADLGISVGLADGDSNDLIIDNCIFHAPNGGLGTALTLDFDHENVIVSNSIFNVDASTAVIDIPTAGNAQVNFTVDNCIINSLNADEFAIQANGTGNTGTIKSCILISDAEATILDAGGLQVSEDTRLVVTGNGEPGVLPADMGLVDLLGDFTGPDDGAAQDDNVKASLDLAHTDLDAILAQAASFSSPNYLAVSTGVFDTTGTWSTVASHEIATVTGLVRMIIIPECTVSVDSVSNTGTIELGDEVGSTSIIAASTLGAGVMVAGELWTDATLTRTILTQTQIDATTIVVGQGQDIGYEVKTNALSAGTIVFHIFWTPLDSTGAVAAGAGGTL